MPSVDLAPRCARHPHDGAGWRCGKCGAALCPACASWRAAGQGTLETCNLCGGFASPIRVRRGLLSPFGPRSLLEAMRWPFHREALLTTLACGVVFWLIGKAGLLAGMFAFGVVLAVCFHVTTLTVRGGDELRSAGEFRGFFEDVIGPLVRALFAGMWAYAPAVWFLYFRCGFDLDRLSRTDTGAAAALLLAGAFLFPMALLVAALGAPAMAILNPLLVLGSVRKLGRDYLLVAAFAFAVSLAESLLLAVVRAVDPVVAIPGFLEDSLLLLPAFMLFRALGLLVRARGDELGYGGSAWLVPVLGARRPDTQLGGAE
jgi:hypothetical protein